MAMMTRTLRTPLLLIAMAAAILLMTGCQDLFLERATKQPKPSRIGKTNFNHEVDPILRGTVASEGVLTGFQPTVVRGYGLVVGLKGTGSRLVPANVRAMMLAEMSRRGVGDSSIGWGHLSPEGMIDSLDTAVVVVEGVIPPGATKGSTFDVRVFVLPGSSTTSLESGRLYTTDLRPGALASGSKQAFPLATASGPIFINPFIRPGSTQSDAVNRLSGRILQGGKTKEDMPVKLRLATTSHARAMTVQQAINSNFPREPGQSDDTARGESGDSLVITIPPSHAEETERFMQLLRHTSLMVGQVDATSQVVRRGLLANPVNAPSARWRWCALGPKAVPMIQDLYDHPEESPRFAALSAGAHLDDALVVPHLLDLAEKSSSKKRRLLAIQHLGRMGVNPRIDIGLRRLLEDEDVDIRLATFESMLERRDPIIQEATVDGKFLLNQIACSYPMIYISQTGQPRIAVFGSAVELANPLTLNTWEGRLLMKRDSEEDDKLQVFYRPDTSSRATIILAPEELPDFITFLAHQTSVDDPSPGLDLGYGETISAIHELWRSGYVPADFKAEQDRVLAMIIANETDDERISRPEFDSPDPPADYQPTRPGDPNATDLSRPSRTGLEGQGIPRDTVPR
ncbi:MAG: flagellar basal body P-ring protein FlgI [Phycisphaerales bacterium]|nr:flagellar basal body P-ring protein FlgI [Phycisphaerales bacterium]